MAVLFGLMILPPGRQKMNSQHANLEREIGNMNRPLGRLGRSQSGIAGFVKIAKQKAATAIEFCRNKGWAIAVSGRRLLQIATRPEKLTRAYQPKAITRVPRTLPNQQSVRRSGLFLVSICFGLLCVCGVTIAALFLQIRDMKVEIARWEQNLSATKTRLDHVERIERERITKEARTVNAAPRRTPVTLSNDDTKAIRAFIKVLPSKPGSQQKIHVGEEVSDTSAVPMPDSLVNQIPKLRGSRFIVDDNGAIILIGEGSNHADAIIEPQ